MPTILSWVENLIDESPEVFLDGKDSANDFALTQILQGLAFLGCKAEKNSTLGKFLEFYGHQMSIDMSPQHLALSPSIAWSLSAMDSQS